MPRAFIRLFKRPFGQAITGRLAQPKAMDCRSCRLEMLEDRRVLAVAGEFLRLDAIAGDDLYAYGDVYAAARKNVYTLTVSDPPPQEDYDQDLAEVVMNTSATNGGGTATAYTSVRSEIDTLVGQMTKHPSLQQTATQHTSITASPPDPDVYGGSSSAEARTRGFAAFQYHDFNPGTDVFHGMINIGGGGSGGFSRDMYDLAGISFGGVMHIEVYKNTELLADLTLEVSGIGDSSYSWLTGTVVGYDPIDIFVEGGGGHYALPFYTPINEGDVISYSSGYDGLPSAPSEYGIIASTGATIIYNPFDETVTASASGSETSSVFGTAIDSSSVPTPPPPGLPIIAPGDLNGDGKIDHEDAYLWATKDYLVVTTEDDVVNGDYRYGDLSLREAIALSADVNHPGEDTIVFAPWVNEIQLSQPSGAQQFINIPSGPLNIIGPGADKLAVTGATGNFAFWSGVFSGGAGTTLIRGMRITGGGGGINSFGSLTVDQCQIDGNTGQGLTHGGFLFSIGRGNLVISNSTIANNVGGIQVRELAAGFTSTIRNSTISSNSSSSGSTSYGGVRAHAGSKLSIYNSTIASNASTVGIAGISTVGSNVLVRLENTIVANNYNNGIRSDVSAATDAFNASSKYNLISHDPSMTNGINSSATNQVGGEFGGLAINAMLSALGYYGGVLKTHALLAASPAIDKGDPAFSSYAFTPAMHFDERGWLHARVQDGDGLNGARVDIGAYEFDETPLAFAASIEDHDKAFEEQLTLPETMALTALGY